MPSSAEKILTQVPFRGATATVLPSGLMATSGQIDGDADGDPAPPPERGGGPAVGGR